VTVSKSLHSASLIPRKPHRSPTLRQHEEFGELTGFDPYVPLYQTASVSFNALYSLLTVCHDGKLHRPDHEERDRTVLASILQSPGCKKKFHSWTSVTLSVATSVATKNRQTLWALGIA
jgi:hypothetical protein